MRAQFSEWYELDVPAMREMVETGTIALDANVLLDLYRFGAALRDKVLDVLLDPQVRPRLFVPYQAALEYQRNRLTVGHEQSQRFGVLRSELHTFIANLEKKAGGTLRDKDILKSVTEAVNEKGNELAEILTALEEKHVLDYRKIRTNDGIRTTIDKMLVDDGQIGMCPDDDELKKRIGEGLQRFEDGVQTPGLADYKKSKPHPEGDYLIWRELLDHAAAHDRPLLFITGDTKDDWYEYAKGERLGPHTKLKEEMLAVTGRQFHYHQTTLDTFLLLARTHLGLKFDDSDVANVAAATVEPDDTFTSTHSGRRSQASVWARWDTMQREQINRPHNLDELAEIIEKGSIIETEFLDQLIVEAPDASRTKALINAVAKGELIDSDTLARILKRLSPSVRDHFRNLLTSSSKISASTVSLLLAAMHPADRRAHDFEAAGSTAAIEAATNLDPSSLRSAKESTEYWRRRL